MSTVHDPQLVERAYEAATDALKPYEAGEFHDIRLSANRAAAKAVAAVLDLLAAEGRLTAQPEPEPAGVRPWDVKDGCW